MNEQELREFCLELIAHLDYMGWGDVHEREVSKELHQQATKFLEDNQ